MKQVIFGDKPTINVAHYSDREHLLNDNAYIGMTDKNDDKYMVIGGGSMRGCIVSSVHTYTSDSMGLATQDRFYNDCTFYVFATKNELLEWMKDEEKVETEEETALWRPEKTYER